MKLDVLPTGVRFRSLAVVSVVVAVMVPVVRRPTRVGVWMVVVSAVRAGRAVSIVWVIVAVAGVIVAANRLTVTIVVTPVTLRHNWMGPCDH